MPNERGDKIDTVADDDCQVTPLQRRGIASMPNMQNQRGVYEPNTVAIQLSQDPDPTIVHHPAV